MEQHILLEKARIYKNPGTVATPEGYTFNEEKGYWIDKDGFAMLNNPDSDYGQTKKCDIETGEDQKGE